MLTTLSAAQAAVNGIRALKAQKLQVRSLQDHHRRNDPDLFGLKPATARQVADHPG